MTMQRQACGRDGEALAEAVLLQSGYCILARNYRNRLGEIDIVARDGETLVFVEVKTRRSKRFGSAKLAVTAAKQKQLSRVALAYLKDGGRTGVKARFDVVAIDTNRQPPRVEVIQNAFDLRL